MLKSDKAMDRKQISGFQWTGMEQGANSKGWQEGGRCGNGTALYFDLVVAIWLYMGGEIA
jgi:hypothetical protein